MRSTARLTAPPSRLAPHAQLGSRPSRLGRPMLDSRQAALGAVNTRHHAVADLPHGRPSSASGVLPVVQPADARRTVEWSSCSARQTLVTDRESKQIDRGRMPGRTSRPTQAGYGIANVCGAETAIEAAAEVLRMWIAETRGADRRSPLCCAGLPELAFDRRARLRFERLVRVEGRW